MSWSFTRARAKVLVAAALPALALAAWGAGSEATGKPAALAATRSVGSMEALYRALPFGAAVTPASLQRTVAILRRRSARLHLQARRIESHAVGGRPGVRVIMAGGATGRFRAEELGVTTQLYFYDWESNVIGANGQPAPTDAADTGGIEAGIASAGLPEYAAVLRAASRAAILPPADSDLASYSPDCTPQANEATSGENAGCFYGQWYLLDESNHSVLRGPQATRSGLYAGGLRNPRGAKVNAVHVNPGTVVLRALQEAPGFPKAREPRNRWYVVNDNPVLTGNDLRNPRQEFESQGQGAPDVAFDFTSHGREVFERVTKEIAKRGENLARPGVRKQDTLQHFAIVLDDQLITTPTIDWLQYPEGINAKHGSEITGGFTLTSAQKLAAELQAGALPLRLELVSVRRARSG
jgi:hypothetical protein